MDENVHPSVTHLVHVTRSTASVARAGSYIESSVRHDNMPMHTSFLLRHLSTLGRLSKINLLELKEQRTTKNVLGQSLADPDLMPVLNFKPWLLHEQAVVHAGPLGQAQLSPIRSRAGRAG